MKLINMNCPNCGSKLLVDKESGECVCNSCGSSFMLDDESTTQHIDFEGAEEAGYQFEKGRQKAQSENRTYSTSNYTQTAPRKRRTWLWVLGWLFIFPLPLTILLVRSKSLNNKVKIGIIAAAWVIYLIIALAGNASNGSSGTNNASSNANSGITSISLAYGTNEYDMTVGDDPISNYITVSVRYNSNFTSDDIVFVSDNPEIATISFTEAKYSTRLYYEIMPVSEGETYVYATSADGSVSTEKIHVVVHGIVEASSISITDDSVQIVLGESRALNASVLPEETADKSITWSSSDDSVVTVDSSGNVTGIGAGEAVITATTSNGLSDTCTITVDGSQRVFNLTISRQRDDSNNIGDEWSHVRQINGENAVNGPYILSVGDTLTFYVKATEDDNVPDVGEATITYTVTEDDFENGFSVEVEVYATENGGPNSGQSAHFITTFSFEI